MCEGTKIKEERGYQGLREVFSRMRKGGEVTWRVAKESSFYKGSVDLIWHRAMKWLPAMTKEEGVEGMTSMGGGKFSVDLDEEGGACV